MKKFKLLIAIFISLCIIGVLGYFYISDNDLFKKQYEVTFNANGGVCETTSVKVENKSTIELPSTSRVGYDFEGWFCDGVQWLEDSKVTKNTTLVAKWKAQEFDITFIVDGVKYLQKVAYDTIPVFDGEPTKEPTTTIEYTFTGWLPELKVVSGDATYTAQFTEKERKYQILSTKSHDAAGEIVGTGLFTYLSSATLEVVENKGYTFVGWYKNEVLYSTGKTIQIDNINEDIELYAKFEIVSKCITYISDIDIQNPNKTQYDIRDGSLLIENVFANGYEFNGWYTGEDGTGEKITQINSETLVDYTLYADWDIIIYTISYNLKGGSVYPENRTEFTIETETFTLNNPTRTDYEFVGWKGTGLTEATVSVTVEKGTYWNLQFTAVWHGESLTFVVDGVCLDNEEIYEVVGTPIYAPQIDGADYGMDGYYIDSWYTDEECTIPYIFTTMPSKGVTLYGTWIYSVGEGFYPYLVKFNGASTQTALNINSYSELIAWIEYIQFYNIMTKYKINLSYLLINTNISNEISKAYSDARFKSGAIVLQTTMYNEPKICSVYVHENYTDVEATLMYSGYTNYTYEQLDYANCQVIPNTREDNYDNFKINNIKKSLTVSTSLQLVYALEKGLLPICVPGSSAERVYNSAKNILRQIIDDEMDDIQKLRAIYEWLIINVEYDNRALDFSSTKETYKYKTFYAEGVFEHGVAVCSGIAEALLIMAQIEKIPTIYVEGNNHAWNKVMVDGVWYGIDATHGNKLLSNSKNEYLTYDSFLFTDAYKTAKGYSTQDYSEIKATTEFNVYDYLTISNTDIDLLADSDDDVVEIVNALKDYDNKNKIYTIEFAVSYKINLGSLIFKIERNIGVQVESFYLLGSDSLGNKIYIFLVA